MKKALLTTFFVVTFFAICAVSAAAVVDDTILVGLRYGDSALFSANLENAEGEGYEFGWFDDDRQFEALGWTEETAISMTAAGDIYMSAGGNYSEDEPAAITGYLGPWHVEIDSYRDFDDAQEAARDYGGYPAWIDGEYVVRVGAYETERSAERAADDIGEGYAVCSSNTGILVTGTRTTDILFEYDDREIFGVQPDNGRKEPVTWFKGYKYPGAFAYSRTRGGNLSVINVVDLEEYVKGVIPYEMNGDWPLAALEAQAVCARTYACRTSKHLSAYGFDVCATTDCQVYYGRGSGGAAPTSRSDRAVENTEGEMLYYHGDLVQDAVYHSSNGGATEDAANVWGGEKGYLQGKEDPYEAQTAIPNYSWSVTYTADELTWILEQKPSMTGGKNIGTVKNVYVSEYTPMGNVKKVTFEGTKGSLTVTGDTCRTIFYSSTYGKSVPSLRFGINGGGPSAGSGGVTVNGNQTLSGLDGLSVISGSGKVSRLEGDKVSVITAAGVSQASVTTGGSTAKTTSSKNGTFTITGTGNGHGVGMSQYGAKAMAELGYDYQEILEFYYTDITIR